MARRRYRNGPSGSHTGYVARRVVVSPLPTFRLGPVDPIGVSLLRQIEDRRTWHPDRTFRPAVGFPRSATRLVAKPSPLRENISSRVGFAVPKRVAICVRRKQRKEVLHALGKAGGGVSRVRRRNMFSDVDC